MLLNQNLHWKKNEDKISIKEDLIQISTEIIPVQTTKPNSFAEWKDVDTNACALQKVPTDPRGKKKKKYRNPTNIVVRDSFVFRLGWI